MYPELPGHFVLSGRSQRTAEDLQSCRRYNGSRFVGNAGSEIQAHGDVMYSANNDS